MASIRLSLAALAPGFALLVGACSVPSESYSTDADTGSTHAIVSVERSTSAEAAGTPRAAALVGFMHMPASVNAASVMQVVGLELGLPAPGECTEVEAGEPPTAPAGDVEFLDAGEVSIEAVGAETMLAPRAFPTVTDLVSGVVYTTRDRSAEPLPADVTYTLRTSGSASLMPQVIEGDAPAMLEGVTVGGIPLSEVYELPVSEPLDLTWDVGGGDDLIFVELSHADGSQRTICSFNDDSGAGSIPAGTFASLGAGTISVHRTRSVSFVGNGLDQGELRFDFELTTSVDFTN